MIELYLSHQLWPSDNDSQCSYLHHQILHAISTGKPLPPELHIQCDNAKDLKCAGMFEYVAILIKKKYFKHVLITTLLAGHTHDEIDQMFGCL